MIRSDDVTFDSFFEPISSSFSLLDFLPWPLARKVPIAPVFCFESWNDTVMDEVGVRSLVEGKERETAPLRLLISPDFLLFSLSSSQRPTPRLLPNNPKFMTSSLKGIPYG